MTASLLARAHDTLEAAGIAHALVGAAALAVHGVSRSTFDRDLLVWDPRALDSNTWHVLPHPRASTSAGAMPTIHSPASSVLRKTAAASTGARNVGGAGRSGVAGLKARRTAANASHHMRFDSRRAVRRPSTAVPSSGASRSASARVISAAIASCQNSPLAPAGSTASALRTSEPGAASDRLVFQAKLSAVNGAHSTGVMRFEIAGGEFIASVHAAGLDPRRNIPQHIHVNPTCNPGGGVLINLDANLTVAGEAPSTGAAFPRANAGGVVNDQARRSLTDLITAVNTFFPTAGVQTVADLLAFLNLEQRNGHMHVSVGPPFPAVNCGAIDQIN